MPEKHVIHRPFGQRGYVLIFVIGVVFVLSVMVLGLSSVTRIDAGSVAAKKKLLQSEYLLKGAVQRVAWGLESGQLPMDLLPGPQAKEPFELDNYLRRPLTMQLEGQSLRVQIDDATTLIDPNRLTRDMWIRLGFVLGLDASASEHLGDEVERARAAHGAISSAPLFRDFHDLSVVNGLSRALIFGTRGGAHPALLDLLVFGKVDDRLDLNYSPLSLYKVVHNTSEGQLRALAAWRTQRWLTPQDEQRLLGGVPAAPQSTTPVARSLRVLMSFSDAAAGAQQIVAFVDLSPGTATIKSMALFFRP